MAGTDWRRHSYPVNTLDDAVPNGSPVSSLPSVQDEAPQTLPRTIKAVKDAENTRHNKGRNLIICLDGTGDKFDADNSNIVHIVGCLKKDDPSQVTYYQSGIGTYDGGGLSNGFNAAADMAVGSGLGVHIQDAYHFLMQTYREGDKIHIFGFSRGAYTARCLCGMLHKCGLLPAHNVAQVPFAYQFYKDDTDNGWEMSADFKKTFCIDVNVYFVGVFDCVASVGFVPRKLPLSSTPSSKTGHFRHAISLDERRSKFKPCLWRRQQPSQGQQHNDARVKAAEESKKQSNGFLRRASTGFSGKEKGQTASQQANGKSQQSKQNKSKAEQMLRKGTGKIYKETDVLEVWFMGCHADVGGGAVANKERHKLSQIPLRWMLRQCFECDTGIIFSTAALAEVGIDVHNLWPIYKPQTKPVVGPSPTIMDKYESGLLSPIQHRSSHYETFSSSSTSLSEKQDPEDSKMHFAEGDGTLRPPTGPWTDELVEDYFDSLAPINDQLVAAKGWWVLEIWPIKRKIQRKGSDEWVKKISMNLGRYRAVQEGDPRMHWTVRQRLEEKRYRMQARVGRNAVWEVVA